MQGVEDLAASIRALGARILEQHGVVHRHQLYKAPMMAANSQSQVMNAYSMTRCKQLVMRTKDVLAHNVLESQRQPDDTGPTLEAWTDYEHVHRLSQITAADLEGLLTTATDHQGNTFHLLPEQVTNAFPGRASPSRTPPKSASRRK